MSATCALCLGPSPSLRVSGVDLCTDCGRRDPSDALVARGIAVEWDLRLGRLSAGLGLPVQDADFKLSCVPELLVHKAAKLFSHEVQVGDPTFDDRIFVRTSDPERAAAILASEGIQSALLALLSDVRTNELLGNHVTLEGPSLTMSCRPLGGLDEDRALALKLEVAALALQLVG